MRRCLVWVSLTLGFLLIGLHAAWSATYVFETIDVPDAVYTTVQGINDRGDIVGVYATDPFGPSHGFLDTGKEFTTIDFPEGSNTTALGINDSNQIVGSYTSTEQQSFIYTKKRKNTTFTPIKVPFQTGVFLTRASDINDRGQIVGEYLDNPTSNEQHGFLYNKGLFTPIDVSGANITSATGINNHGDIVGFYEDADGLHGFISSRREFTTIDVSFTDAFDTTALGISDHGDIVGMYQDPQGIHGYVLSRGLFTSIDVPGASLTIALGINKADQIVGFYQDGTGMHGFVATPRKKKSNVASLSQTEFAVQQDEMP